jgi:two-component system, chemotaxis family, chemotaxis protein CheY
VRWQSRRVILVVEDDEHLRQLYRFELEMRGFVVEAARDGLEALELVDEGPRPDLVVLDLIMPRVSGLAVAQELRAHAETREIPLLLVTGSEDPIEELAFTEVLHKPVDASALVTAVQRCLASPRDPRAPTV